MVWGLVGGRWSRFASFVYAPGTVLRYLRGESRADEHHEVGHNPLGAFSVFGLLALLVVQVATGLVADDEIVHHRAAEQVRRQRHRAEGHRLAQRRAGSG